MHFIIIADNLARLVDPAAAVEQLAVGGWDVDPDVDGEGGVLCCFTEAEDKGAAGHGEGEGEGLCGGGGYVVCGFGEEECLMGSELEV